MKNLLLKTTLFVACFCTAAFFTNTNAQTTLFDVDGKMHVNTTGNVGIGTVTPTQKLDLQDGNLHMTNTGFANPEIRIYSDDGLGTSSLQFKDLSPTQGRIDKVSASGTALIDFNPIPSNGTSSGSFRFFRATNTTGPVFFEIFKGDGTGTKNGQIGGNVNTYFAVDNSNVGIGTTTPATKLNLSDGDFHISTTGAHLNPEMRIFSEDGAGTSSLRVRDLSPTQARLDKESASGVALIDFNPTPLDNTSNASFRFFRATNTTGLVFYEIYKGNGTGTKNAQIGGNTNTYFAVDNSNVGIGTSTPAFLLEVNGVAAKPGGGSWTVASDSRLKKDVREFTDGLALINQIEPKTFTYNGKAGIKTQDEFVGIIAQDMQKIAPYMVSEFEAEDGNSYLSFNPSALDFVLVNAIKEQQEKIAALEEEVAKAKNYDDAIKNLQEGLAQLQNENEALSSQMAQFDIDLQQCCLSHQNGSTIGSTNGLDDKAHLAQNIPNPFNQKTIIKYYLPKDASQAQIRISDLQGNLIKLERISEKGYGQIEIDANILAPGTYLYELVVGNERIDTKRMIIQK